MKHLAVLMFVASFMLGYSIHQYQTRAAELPAVPPFESGIRSPYGDFTDNDGQRQTAEDVLWECYYQARKFSQEWPDLPAESVAFVYRACLLDSEATI